jgi:hypothetical protein
MHRICCNLLADPAYGEVEGAGAGANAPQSDLVQKPWQNWPAEADLTHHWIAFEAERGLNKPQQGSGSPGLRGTGDGIIGWSAFRAPREAAEEFWQAAKIIIGAALNSPSNIRVT